MGAGNIGQLPFFYHPQRLSAPVFIALQRSFDT